MKLRIKGNTIRIRLTQGEVDQFRDTGRVADGTRFNFPGSSAFTYALECDEAVETLFARFEKNMLTILVPKTMADQWTGTNQVGFSNESSGKALPVPYILIEKDFQCLHRRPHEDETDHFPNPMSGETS